MSVQSRRKSRFTSLGDEQDGKERMHRVQIQCHFTVSYIGETPWRDDFMYVNEILQTLLPKQSRVSGRLWFKKEPQRKVSLFIDLSTTAVHIQTAEGVSEKCFKFSNIREVIYCGNMKQYSKYVILVASGEANTNGHIFACASVREAKNAFKILTDLFKRKKKPDFNLEVEDEVFTDGVGNSPQPSNQRQNISSKGEPMSPEVEDNFVESAFTALARSRSFSAGHGQRYSATRYEQLHQTLPVESLF